MRKRRTMCIGVKKRIGAINFLLIVPKGIEMVVEVEVINEVDVDVD